MLLGYVVGKLQDVEPLKKALADHYRGLLKNPEVLGILLLHKSSINVIL